MTKSEYQPITPIRRMAQDIKHHPHDIEQSIEALFPTHEASHAIWKELKPEMYAIMAVLIDDIVPKAIKHKFIFSNHAFLTEVLGLFVHRDHEIFYNVFSYTVNTLGKYTKQEKTRGLRLTNHPLHDVWLRYEDLDTFLLTYIRNIRHEETDTILARGVGTASRIMANVLEVIPQVYHRDYPHEYPDALAYTTIAKNSFPLVTQLAMMQLGTFVDVNIDISQHKKNQLYTTFNPDYFVIRPTAHEYELDHTPLSPPGKPRSYEPRIGCPAMVNFGDGSAVSKLWQWHIHMAPTIYQAAIDARNM